MNRQEFEKRNTDRWRELDEVITGLERNRGDAAELPGRFRRVCHDLALARYRMFGQGTCEYLNALTIRGYKLMHRPEGATREGVVRFFARTFPQCVRSHSRLFWASSLFFWLPFLLMMVSVHYDVAWVQAMLGPAGMESMDSMYGEGQDTVEHLRSEYGSNFMMFAHYINNNVGIDFRLYAGGVLFGLGTVFVLLFNGLYIGAAAGYVNYAGDPQKFWQFVAGHSSFEILGMIVVGMAGLKLGIALLAPGQLRRGAAVAKAGKEGLPLLLGGAAMTAVAAVVEGFWSARAQPAELKYAVGIFFWLAHVLYFLTLGRVRYGD